MASRGPLLKAVSRNALASSRESGFGPGCAACRSASNPSSAVISTGSRSHSTRGGSPTMRNAKPGISSARFCLPGRKSRRFLSLTSRLTCHTLRAIPVNPREPIAISSAPPPPADFRRWTTTITATLYRPASSPRGVSTARTSLSRWASTWPPRKSPIGSMTRSRQSPRACSAFSMTGKSANVRQRSRREPSASR